MVLRNIQGVFFVIVRYSTVVLLLLVRYLYSVWVVVIRKEGKGRCSRLAKCFLLKFSVH